MEVFALMNVPGSYEGWGGGM